MRLKYLIEYVGELATFVGMPQWFFRVSVEQAEEGCYCEIQIEDYDEATLKVGSRFWEETPLMKTQTLLHELFHCPVGRIHDNIVSAAESVIDLVPEKRRAFAKQQLHIHMKSVHRNEEAFVNQLGTVLAPYAPKWKCPRK